MGNTLKICTFALFCTALVGCDTKSPEKKPGKPVASKSAKSSGPSQAELDCRKEKTTMLSQCQPGCDADPSLKGEAYDGCLQECAVEKFGKEIPMCTGL
jgi:hypothetical protein